MVDTPLNIVQVGNDDSSDPGSFAEDDHNYFRHVIFLLPIVLIGVLLLHLAISLIFFCGRKDLPDQLTFPRLEIMFGFFSAPILTIASSRLYTNASLSTFHFQTLFLEIIGDALIATWVTIAFPILFVCWCISIVWHVVLSEPVNKRSVQMFVGIGEHFEHDTHFLRRAKIFLLGKKEESPPQGMITSFTRRQNQPIEVFSPFIHSLTHVKIELAAMMRTPQRTTNGPSADPTLSHEEDIESGRSSDITTTTSTITTPSPITTSTPTVSSFKGFQDVCHFIYGFLNATVLYVILGRRQPTAKWVGIRSQGAMSMAKYGFIFEDYRGPPVVRE